MDHILTPQSQGICQHVRTIMDNKGVSVLHAVGGSSYKPNNLNAVLIGRIY